MFKYQTHSNKTLRCEFGFINSIGEIPIVDMTMFGKLYSSAMQYVDTVVPRDSAMPNEMKAYCRCFDSSGKRKTKYQTIALVEERQGDEDPEYFNLHWEKPRVSDIIIQSWMFSQTWGSGISKWLKTLNGNYQEIIDYIHSSEHQLNLDEIKQLAFFIYHLSGQQLRSKTVESLARACEKLIAELHNISINEETFLVLSSAVDNLTRHGINYPQKAKLQKYLFDSLTDFEPSGKEIRYDSMVLKNTIHQQDIRDDNNNEINFDLGGYNPVQVKIPSDKIFASFHGEIMFASIVTQGPQYELKDHIKLEKVPSASFVSEQITLEARVYQPPTTLTGPGRSAPVKVRGLEEKIELVFPHEALTA